MSYYLHMRFARAETTKDAVAKAYSVLQSIAKENILNSMINNVHYMDGKNSQELRMYLHFLLKLKFVYFKKAKLLAFYSGEVNFDFEKFGFGQAVIFQNSTDQDYDFETWKAMHGALDVLIAQYRTLPAEYLLKRHEDISLEDFQLNPEYWRKSWVYQHAFKDFGIEDWLEEQTSDDFESFAFSLINQQNEEVYALTKAKAVLKIYDYYFDSEVPDAEYRYVEDFIKAVFEDEELWDKIFPMPV